MIGPNLLLRAPEPEDVDIIFKWENNTRFWHIGNTLAPYSRFAVEQFVMNVDNDIFSTKQLRFMIDSHSKDDKPTTIGMADLFEFDPHHKRAGVGILIDELWQGKGYATEAINILVDYCFRILNLHQLYCNIEITNEKSIKLFTKCGFVQIGLKKDWLMHDGHWTDALMFQLINKI
jgi:diamine N-acetyltransferase